MAIQGAFSRFQPSARVPAVAAARPLPAEDVPVRLRSHLGVVGGPRPLLSALLGAFAALAICVPTWPGLMSFDSLYAYKQSITGVETAVWPPAHDYYMYLSRVLTGGPGGLFALQVFVLFASAASILAMLVGSRRGTVLSFLGLLVACFWFPTVLGTTIVSWKDVPLTSFCLLAVALWLSNQHRPARWKIVAVAVALAVGVAVRHNGLPLVVPFLVLLVWKPFPTPVRLGRTLAVVGVAAALALAFASTVWRLPDLQRLPPTDHALAPVQLWDLVGVSVCAGENLLPPSYQGSSLSAAQLGVVYDPRHLNLTFQQLPGRTNLPELTAASGAETAQRWREVVPAHLGCYLHHRWNVFAEQLGLRPAVFYPTHGGIDQNPYGLALSHPRAASRVMTYVTSHADGPARRAVWIQLGAAFVLLWSWVLRRGAPLVPTALYLGGVAYIASLFFLAPAADARYIFPSNVFALLAVAMVLCAAVRGLPRGGEGSGVVAPELGDAETVKGEARVAAG